MYLSLVSEENGIANGYKTNGYKTNGVEKNGFETNGFEIPSKPNAWTEVGQAAYDFRSDYVTSPSAAMLESIIKTTLLDDVMMEDPTTNSFQSFMAELTGKEAALLVSSGTMGNQIALRSALQVPPYSILCDARGHILHMEAGGAATLWGALVEGVVPENRHHLTVSDIKKAAVLKEGVYDCPTRIISLENTLSGTIMPLSEVRAISAWAHQQNPPLHMHLDGARLWEAASAGAGTLKEFAECFDSVSLCFTKGLGAPIGSIIVGSAAFIKRARAVRKLLGGGMRQTGVIAAPARIAVEKTFLSGRLKQVQDRAKFIADTWVSLGGKLRNPTETNMIWLDLDAAGIDKPYFAKVAKDHGLKTMQGRLEDRLVVHYQISQEAVDILINVFRFVLKK
ncbi:MAG: putative low-specificity L-threonine aldolase 1 [Bathelium mastoideum]|nr:MAG: putative low-specificity L-threonine aldolase 1 [Bathelium mastoideum]KAI9685401.1 MAG: putative low-specificity L-threonine aldolase 1 [Bathelium mastoideum]